MSPIAVSDETHRKHTASVNKQERLLARLVPFALVSLSAAYLLFGDLGKYPLFNPDEALYAEPAREMLENGDYITTYLNYVVRFTKPPLVIWAQALGITLFGVNEFAVRFFEAASGLVLVAATYVFGEKFAGRRVAIAGALALATAPLFIGTAREAITDMPLSLFTAGAMMSFFTAQRTQSNKMLWLGWILTGLSVMTKGPVGVVLPIGILGAYAFVSGRLRSFFSDYKVLVGAGIVSLIALPWFIAEIAITKGAYFHEFIMRENVQRFTSAIDSHGQPWWYHLAAMFGGFLPWSLFLFGAFSAVLPRLVKDVVAQTKALLAFVLRKPAEVRADTATKASGEGTAPGGSRDNTRERLDGVDNSLAVYCTIWALGTLVFYSASVSKLLPYTMPAFPAMAILVAIEFERILQTANRKKALIPLVILAVAFGGASTILPVALHKLRDTPPTLIPLLCSFLSYELVFVLAAAVLTARRLFRASWAIFCIPTILGMMFFGAKLLTCISDQWEGPLPAMAHFAGQSDQVIYVYDMRKPSLPFYTRKQVTQPSNPDQLVAALKQAGQAYILTKRKKKEFLQTIPGCKVLREDGSFLLAAYRRPSD